MTACPARCAVIQPLWLTEATVGSELVHVTSLRVRLPATAREVSCLPPPSTSENPVSLSVMRSTAGSCTVTVHSAVLPPAVTVTTALPLSTAVTTPSFTVTMSRLLERQRSTPLLTPSGRTVAVSSAVLPYGRVSSVRSSLTPVMRDCASVGVRSEVWRLY